MARKAFDTTLFQQKLERMRLMQAMTRTLDQNNLRVRELRISQEIVLMDVLDHGADWSLARRL